MRGLRVPDPLFRLLFLLALLSATGCGTEPPAAANTQEPTPRPALFDPARCGRVEGRVSWDGQIFELPQFLFGVPKRDGGFDMRMMPNPNRMVIDPESRGVANAVVFLRKVDLAAAKPWDLPAVRVEMTDCNIVVKQGDSPPRRVGFVRRGESVQITATDPFFHALRGRGAAFFTYTFPEPDRPRRRTFDTAGRVELSSAAGFYWASADLFVDDHPYYTLTDCHGSFVIDNVPAGRVEVVVWVPNFMVQKQERDPESGLITRQTYAPPLERTRPLDVQAGAARQADFAIP
jgi:hypothetical protein